MTKETATANAKILKAKMKTKGWKIRVWENFGWNYSIQNGYMGVSPCFSSGKYFAMLATEIGGAGVPTYWHDPKVYRDPNKAVKQQLARAQTFVTFSQNVIDEQRQLLTGKRK